MTNPTTKTARILKFLLGLIFILPAAGCCAATLLLPAIQTFIFSLQKMDGFTLPQFVGLQNFQALAVDPAFSQALTNTMLIMGERLLAAALTPLLLALAANGVGGKVTLAVRLLSSFPLAFALPTVATLGWLISFQGASAGQINLPTSFISPLWLRNPATARWTLLGIDFITTSAIVCGLGVIIFLAVLQHYGPETRFPRRTLLGTWVVGLVAVTAWTLPEFMPSLVLTSGGPSNLTTTLGYYTYIQGFRFLKIGSAAAIQILMLLPTMLLGLAAVIGIVLTGIRLETTGRQAGEAGHNKRLRLPLAFLLTVLLLFGGPIFIISILPLASSLQLTGAPGILARLSQQVPLGNAVTNTLLPALFSVLVIQLPLGYLAAFGIGGLRPLGRFSEWLLLLFAPWLFVSQFQLTLSDFSLARDLKLLNNPVTLYTTILNIPILVVLTLFFKGQAAHWEADAAAGVPRFKALFTRLVLPSLPLSALLGGISLVAQVQELLPALVLINQRQIWPLSLWALNLLNSTAFPNPGILIVAYSWLVVGLASLTALLLLQVFYLKRLVIRGGKPLEVRDVTAPAE